MQDGAFVIAAMKVSETQFLATTCNDPCLAIARGENRAYAVQLLGLTPSVARALEERDHKTMGKSKFIDGAQLFKVVGRVDWGVGNAEMRSLKYYCSSVLRSTCILKNGCYF